MSVTGYGSQCADKMLKKQQDKEKEQKRVSNMAGIKVGIIVDCRHTMLLDQILKTDHCSHCQRKIKKVAVDKNYVAPSNSKANISFINKAEYAILTKDNNLLQYIIGNDSSLINEHLNFVGSDRDIISTTLLSDAVINNNLPALKYLIKQGADVNLVDETGYTPLDRAVALEEDSDSAEIIIYLLTKGANLHVNDENYSSNALGVAIASEKINSAKIILNFNKDLLYTNCYEGYNLLDTANQFKNPEMVSYIFDMCNKKNMKLPKGHMNSSVSLYTVCKSNKLDHIKSVVKYAKKKLTKRGDFINYMNQHHMGTTALHLACINGDVEIIKYLLKNGAEIDQQDLKGKTPIEILLDNECSIECIKLLLNKIPKKDIHQPQFHGQSIFQISSIYKNTDLSNLLTEEYGYNPKDDIPVHEIEEKTKTPRGKKFFANKVTTAKTVTFPTKEKEVKIIPPNLGYLICENGDGKTPLELAFEEYKTTNNSDTLDQLLETINSSNIDNPISGNETLLMYAIRSKNSSLVEYLTDKKGAAYFI